MLLLRRPSRRHLRPFLVNLAHEYASLVLADENITSLLRLFRPMVGRRKSDVYSLVWFILSIFGQQNILFFLYCLGNILNNLY